MEASYLHDKSDYNDTHYNDNYQPPSSVFESDGWFELYNFCIKYGLRNDFAKLSAWTVILIGFPLTVLAIYFLYSQVRDNHVAPVYVINLLISDLIKICSLVIWMVDWQHLEYNAWEYYVIALCVSTLIFYIGLLVSVGFMVCVALERYLIVTWPLWYRFRCSIKFSVVVSVMVWVFGFIEFIIAFFVPYALFILLLLPFPLLIFFLAGTIKALSMDISVSVKEKQQIIGTLVLVLLHYTLLLLPRVILIMERSFNGDEFTYIFLVLLIFVELTDFSPFADLVLCVFISKGSTEKPLTSLCCCRVTREEEQGRVATINS
ncbi:ovarian cancer G-protein coupled receptor 1-like [Lates calcarifer]|uniref:Ovarian cancer G-protein coupled receptor 1-like n=1 Tax=Lates calcarifer TaxID=8187 RepID=A0AAJ8B1X0_LATCA|nr:ovarian cancer G-protein coupled receptor 1-like [Lates calcarifer]